jgi:steroid delta-isomerase-like uncharacterized protein
MEVPAIVRQYLDACKPATLDAYVATYAADGTYSDPGTPQPLSGGGIKAYMGGLFAAFPDTVFETLAVDVVSENLVAWRWVMHGTNTGSFAGMPATGRQVHLPGCEFIEVRNKKIQRVDGYFDRMTMLGHMGLLPPPPSA